MKNAEGPDSWLLEWKTLIRYLGSLSRKHRLKTLVMSKEACHTFAYIDENGKQPLADKLGNSKIQLDHLVISHTRVSYFLSKIRTKKLTWYGCDDYMIMRNPLDFLDCPAFRWYQLEEINILIGGSSFDRAGHPPSCVTLFVMSIEQLAKSQGKAPKVNVSFHCETQEARARVINCIRQKGLQVTSGTWGKSSDTFQMLAEMESFAAEGWIQRNDCGLLLAKDAYEVKIRADPNFKDDGRGNWTLGPRSKKGPWCGCMHGGTTCADADCTGSTEDSQDLWLAGDSEDLDDLDDTDLDASESWEPMQRLARS